MPKMTYKQLVDGFEAMGVTEVRLSNKQWIGFKEWSINLALYGSLSETVARRVEFVIMISETVLQVKALSIEELRRG